jgi:hypothetical protein
MDTAPLKSFATWARTALIREVSARIAVVLAPTSAQRVERPKAVSALEEAVVAAGGGDKGRAAVADRVAYTWFNRIIALRFMDANGYTGIGVVSPQAGIEVGQPEILAEAKRANIDPDVVDETIRDTVTGLLNGSRRSDDPQGEAYALLLVEYCRHWNRAMPFMFERQGDFTELLMPASLLADDSVLNRAVHVLTEDICQDVEVIGWLYQFYISERKDEVFAGFKRNVRAGAGEIPPATQLFTPHWIVRYLIENSLGRLWMLNRPSSRLIEQMDYYVKPPADETGFLKIDSPEEIKLIDPASGSGHLLTYAFDLLYVIYEEEGYAPSDIPGVILEKNLYGAEIDPRAGALAAFALAMKARARQRTIFVKGISPNIVVLEPISFTPNELDLLRTPDGDREAETNFWNLFANADVFGALSQPDSSLIERLTAHLSEVADSAVDLITQDVVERASRVLNYAVTLSPDYSVVAANPPYMGTKNMTGELAVFAQSNFPSSKADLFAMFIERCLELVAPKRGLVAMITMHSWMFLTSFEQLRKRILAESPPATMAHLGERAFDSIGGSVVATTAFVLQEGRLSTREGFYLRLVNGRNESEKSAMARAAVSGIDSALVNCVESASFQAVPGAPIAYWFPATLLEAFRSSPPLSATARAAKGLVTADNATFVRQWWEVSRSRIGFNCPSRASAMDSGRRWFPYAKGGDFRRWAGNLEAVVNWERDGDRIQTTRTEDGTRVRATNFNLDRIFKPGIAWTVVTTNDPSFRKVDEGFLFDAAAGLCQSTRDEYTLALLNSSSVKQVLAGLNPTMNLHPGYLEAVPAPRDAEMNTPSGFAVKAVELSTCDWNAKERSWDFLGSPLVDRGPVISKAYEEARHEWSSWTEELREIERRNDSHFAELFGFAGVVEDVSIQNVSLSVNPRFAYRTLSPNQAELQLQEDTVRDLVSYAVGCMFGRYSLGTTGLILADQGAKLQDYLSRVPSPSFMPDADNVLPIVDGDWFEDDIVTRFRQFLRVAFGDQHFEENLRFVTEALGTKDLRDYFVKSFYKDHVQRYKKRPIYWLFSSPKGSFNALIYMHRYTSSTVSTVLNEYLREFNAKLTATLGQQERLAAGGGTPRQQAAAQKEADRIRKMLLELAEYEHDVLYPLASEQIEIDLDDGVRVNYPKFGAALKKIPGLEAAE